MRLRSAVRRVALSRFAIRVDADVGCEQGGQGAHAAEHLDEEESLLMRDAGWASSRAPAVLGTEPWGA